MNYTDIFKKYKSKDLKNFFLINRSINFPSDKSNVIYDTIEISENIPWTLLSYKIYNTIDYWWILCSINKDQPLYAEEGKEIYYIKTNFLNTIISNIEKNL